MQNKINRNPHFEQEAWRAICSLASGSENIKKRLIHAYEFHISYLNPDSIPQEENKEKLIAIKNKLTKNYTKPVREAIHHLPYKSCRKMISDLCNIYWEFTNYEWSRHP